MGTFLSILRILQIPPLQNFSIKNFWNLILLENFWLRRWPTETNTSVLHTYKSEKSFEKRRSFKNHRITTSVTQIILLKFFIYSISSKFHFLVSKSSHFTSTLKENIFYNFKLKHSQIEWYLMALLSLFDYQCEQRDIASVYLLIEI